MNAVITISCRICGGQLKTDDVTEALAFERRHNKTCAPQTSGKDTHDPPTAPTTTTNT